MFMRSCKTHPVLVPCLTIGALWMCALTSTVAQLAEPAPGVSIVEIGPHSRVWQRVVAAVDESGNPAWETNSYTELCTGLYYEQEGKWVESQALIEPCANGAAAVRGQHQALFANNLKSAGAIELVLPDGQRLRCTPRFLAYVDPVAGKQELLAEVKNCQGAIAEPNQVLYRDCLDSLKATLRYTYRIGGFEQDVILEESPPPPEKFGLDPATTRLEFWTEFFDPPEPTKTTDVIRPAGQVQENGLQQAIPELVDEQLDFGSMQITRGTAFALNAEAEPGAVVPVLKRWQRTEGRYFLIETVEYPNFKPMLDTLPGGPAPTEPAVDPESQKSGQLRLPPALKPAPALLRPMQLARGDTARTPGVVVDWIALSSSTNYTLKANATYLVSGQVLFSGTTIIEGGAVVKSATNADASIIILGPVECRTDVFRPAVFTSINDNTVGEIISGSTGVPVVCSGGGFSISSGYASTLSHLRVSYASAGIMYYSPAGHVLSHAQFVHCKNGVWGGVGSGCTLRNVLVHDVGKFVMGNVGFTLSGEHVTVNHATNLNYNYWTALALTNSLLVDVLNTNAYSGQCVAYASSGGDVFQTLRAGYHYLKPDSPYRNIGTTSINPTLAAELKRRTTAPPVDLTTDFLVPTTLAPQAQRDTDAPDLGYHYAPLDYVLTDRAVDNVTVQLTNGVAVGIYGINGFSLKSGGRFVSEGTASNPNRLVRYHSVQEQSVGWGNPSGAAGLVVVTNLYPVIPEFRTRFTEMVLLGGSKSLTYTKTTSLLNMACSDCSFWGCNVPSQFCGNYPGTTIALTNNLMYRCKFYLSQGQGYPDIPQVVYLFNNLFYGGDLSLIVISAANGWAVYDNAFDTLALYEYGANIANGNTAYINTGSRLIPPNMNDVVLGSFTYANGPLGGFYQVTTNLYGRGSRSAAAAGLYHHTVRTDQTKEGTASPVTIGFHYVATDANGLPLDYDSDGLADYFEDRNGNGVVNSGESHWQDHDDPGLKVLITRPRNGGVY